MHGNKAVARVGEQSAYLHTYGERHDEFPANNFTIFVQKSVRSELFRFVPNVWIHVHTVQVWDNLQKQYLHNVIKIRNYILLSNSNDSEKR